MYITYAYNVLLDKSIDLRPTEPLHLEYSTTNEFKKLFFCLKRKFFRIFEIKNLIKSI